MRKLLGLLTIIIFLSGGIWFWLILAEEEPRQTLKIGAIAPSKSHVKTVEGFRRRMAQLGFDENSGDEFIFNGPSGRGPGLQSAINELLSKQVDLVFVATTPATQAVKKATKDRQIPVVFGPVSDPVSAQIVETIRSPGGNLTGITLLKSEGRRLELLKEIVPAIKHIFVPFNPKDKSAKATVNYIKQTAQELGLQLILRPVKDNAELSAAIATIPDATDAIFLPRDSMVGTRLQDFGKVALKKNLPLVSASYTSRAEGVLFGFGPDLYEIGKQAAELANRILRTRTPSSHPVQSADNYLFLDLRTAEAIGVNFPDYILYQADKINR